MAQRNPMAAEHKRITINTQIGAIKLDEQVKVEMLVSRSKISRHHPNRYPLMAVLESGVTMVELVKVLMVEERLESRVVPMVEERLGMVGGTTSLRFSTGHTSSSSTSESSG